MDSRYANSSLKNIVRFFVVTASELEHLTCNSEYSARATFEKVLDVNQSLDTVTEIGRVFCHELAAYASLEQGRRNPENLRIATNNLVREVESFKLHFESLYPESNVRNHPFIGSLYGYAQPRTVALDRAALVAQETMIDIWSLSGNELEALVVSTGVDHQVMANVIKDIQNTIRRTLFEEIEVA